MKPKSYSASPFYRHCCISKPSIMLNIIRNYWDSTIRCFFSLFSFDRTNYQYEKAIIRRKTSKLYYFSFYSWGYASTNFLHCWRHPRINSFLMFSCLCPSSFQYLLFYQMVMLYVSRLIYEQRHIQTKS